MIFRYLLGLFILVSLHTFAQSGCPPVFATNDTTICSSSIQLNATAGFTTYSWSPSTGLSNPTIANPIATISSTATYTVTATTPSTNLFINGDFSLGNVGFTSGYTYTTTYSPCNYYVGPIWFGSYFPTLVDHTPTADNMFMHVDGCYTPATTLWEQTITGIMPSTLYDFSFWSSRADAVQPIFEIHFIGNVSGDNIVSTVSGIPYTGIFTWDQYGFTGWNSTTDNTLTVRIINTSTMGYGNDFGLDDFEIHMPACTVYDDVTITLATTAPPLVADTSYCLNSTTAPLNATGQNLIWYNTPGSTGTSVAPIPTTSTIGTNTYYVTQTVNGCESDLAAITVTVYDTPAFELGSDFIICKEEPISLGPNNSSWNYVWSDGTVGSPRLTSFAGQYLLTATNSCGSYTDSVLIVLEDCDCYFYLPNAFTPNSNERNDTFKPVYECEFISYKMEIFDRWGELIFESTLPNIGWDGKYKGQPVEQAVYVVKIRFIENNGAYADERSFLDKVVVVR